jgi:hypothetical protein
VTSNVRLRRYQRRGKAYEHKLPICMF